MSLSRVILSSGRLVELAELTLSSTYGGMLEGYPCKPVNSMKIDGLLRTARREFPGTPAHLIPPPLEYPDRTSGPFGPVEVLPAVACVGFFRSTAIDPGHDPVLYRSALALAWFQPTPAVPSGEDADAGLRAVCWEELAEDYAL
ncbi:hypothetical protein [Streptomyces sp. enrichment culture]|uniref:hypothetical protein n=1 Tax=Streptomyces sp. enrichment culture TaxID=1795815 RepID=UPI003F54B2F3